MTQRFLEGNNIVPAFTGVVADMDTDQSGDYISLKNYGRLGVLFIKAAGTAGDDPTLTLQEATAVDGTDVQALSAIDSYWIKDAVTEGTFTKVTQTAASTLALSATSAEALAVVWFEIDAEKLSAGFDCLRVNAALAASGGAQYGAVMYFLLDPSYPQETALGAIAD